MTDTPYQCQSDGRIMTRHLTPGQHYHESQPDSLGRVTFTPVEQRWVEIAPPTPVDQVAEMAAKLEPERVCGNCGHWEDGLTSYCRNQVSPFHNAIQWADETCSQHQPREEG